MSEDRPTPQELFKWADAETATPFARKQLYLVLMEQHGYLVRRQVLEPA